MEDAAAGVFVTDARGKTTGFRMGGMPVTRVE